MLTPMLLASNSDYLKKIDTCIFYEQSKKELTSNLLVLNDFKYLSTLRALRISECAHEEEKLHKKNLLTNKLKTNTDYLIEDLEKFTTNELIEMHALDSKLKAYSLEGDLLSLYDKVKETNQNDNK
jgi:CO dehydrogenase nickel-insertion accessory protein CooC1